MRVCSVVIHVHVADSLASTKAQKLSTMQLYMYIILSTTSISRQPFIVGVNDGSVITQYNIVLM